MKPHRNLLPLSTNLSHHRSQLPGRNASCELGGVRDLFPQVPDKTFPSLPGSDAFWQFSTEIELCYVYRVLCLNPNCKNGHSKFYAYKQALIHALADTETEQAKAGSAVLKTSVGSLTGRQQ